MKERNADKLRDALNRLPDYDAPGGAWEQISAGLQPALANKLPTYQPAAGVWNAISRELEAAEPARQAVPVAIQRRLPLRKLAGIAAAMALLVTIGLGLRSGYTSTPTVTLAYSQEPAPAQSLIDWEEDEASFANALAEIEARNEPELNALGEELVELTEAKEEVKAMLVAYGDDPQVIRQLAEIERDRSDIYRRIIEL